MIDNTREKSALPSPIVSTICCDDHNSNSNSNSNSNLNRLRPLKCNRTVMRNRANNIAKQEWQRQLLLSHQQQRHYSRIPSIIQEIELEEKENRVAIIRDSGKLKVIEQDLPSACLQSSQVPIASRSRSIDIDNGNNYKTHLMCKRRPKNFVLSRQHEGENKQPFEITTTKVLTTCNESHKSESNEIHRTRQSSLTACRIKSAFFSFKRKQKCRHRYSIRPQASSTNNTMIIKLISLLFVLLCTTNFYFSFGSGDYILSQQTKSINERKQTLAAQATGSSNSNNNNNNNNSNNDNKSSSRKDGSNNYLVLDQLNFLKPTQTSILVYNELPENLALIKRQADDDTDEPATSDVEARNHRADDINNDESIDSDKSTQIPPEQVVSTISTTTTATTTTTTSASSSKKPFSSLWSSAFGGSSTKRSVPVFRVSESELLPFSDFVVQQPAFSDLMKSWPPTTLQSTSPNYHTSHYTSQSSSPYSRVSNAHLQASRNLRQHSRQPHGANWQYSGANNRRTNIDSVELELIRKMRNHLNEDLDDTIITADQSFEQDQLPEPPTWINYLGELGDYIYLQLRQYLEKSLVNSSSSNNDKAVGGGGRQGSVMSDQTSNDIGDNNNSSQYQQQQQQQAQRQLQLKIETVDELLDDYYYDQYENSQVLYYGSQLVREGDILEIGCYLPSDQSAEWTKSGRQLVGRGGSGNNGGVLSSSPRVIRRSDFLGAKQNFSLKVFEASLSDSGNYRCNKMSRKYHKLVVVPLKTTTTQLYLIQQRLLSIVNPSAVSMTGLSVGSRFSAIGLGITTPGSPSQRYQTPGDSVNQASYYSTNNGRDSNQTKQRYALSGDYTMLPGYLIVENQPLVVNCNITDEFVLRRLRENSQFQLSWYKNSRLLRSSTPNHVSSGASNSGFVLPSSGSIGNSNLSPVVSSGSQSRGGSSAIRNNRLQSQQVGGSYVPQRHTNLSGPTNQRIQYLQPNGRQLYITSALYSDAGEYLCSWSNLPARHQPADLDGDGNELIGEQHQQTPTTISNNFLSAGNLVQVMAPVKLRPFKSTYHVRQGNELRLVCFAQRGYPAAHISWYVGNRLVDGDFLKEHQNEFRILNLQNQNQLIGTYSFTSTNEDDHSNQAAPASASSPSLASSTTNNHLDRRKIVEINPIPLNRQQMQLTANGHGSWVEYRDFKNEKYAIETPEQQLKYLKQKLAQLMGQSVSSSLSSNNSEEEPSIPTSITTTTTTSTAEHSNSYLSSLQTSVSVLVINSLNIDKHTSRYSCRATTRANTDEVTTVIRVQASSTIPVRPSTGRATLIPGQPLHFQCETVGNKDAQFIWYRKAIDDERDQLLEPNNDDNIEIHNDRLTLNRPTSQNVGDYYCRALKDDKSSTHPNEFAVIKVRMQPYIEDFGLDTSHTGKSSVITDGDRLELTCTVRDKSAPVNITWLRSTSPDDEKTMVPLPETPPSSSNYNNNFNNLGPNLNDPFGQTFTAPDQNVAITSVNSHSKKLVIDSIRHEHRSYYVCMVDNGITERSRKIIFIRVKDKLIALWPFLGILAELFILFTIIYVWETQRAYKEIHATPPSLTAGSLATSSNAGKRPASGQSAAFENVPLTSG